MKALRSLAICGLLLAFSGAAHAANLLETMKANSNLSEFVALINKAGLDSQFTGTQKLTVLAPTNGAFDSLGNSERRALESTPDKMRQFVLNHVVSGERVAAPGSTEHTTVNARTLGGANLELEFTGAGAGRIDNRIRIVQTNIRADNGIIHTIDSPVGAR